MFYDYYLIPVEVSQWVIQNKFFRQFQVYIHLKTISDGVMYIDNNLIKHIANKLELKSTKTIIKNLKDLEEHNWIGIDKKTKRCYVRGFNSIKAQLGFNGRIATFYYKTDIIDLKAFLIASVISNLIRQGKRKKWLEKALKKSKAHQFSRSSSFTHQVANKGLSKILNIGIATASRYKQLASEVGYIEVKRNYETVYLNGGSIDLHNKISTTKVHKVINGIPVTQYPDSVKSNLVMKRRRK